MRPKYFPKEESYQEMNELYKNSCGVLCDSPFGN